MDFRKGEKRHFARFTLKVPLHYQIRGRPEFNNTLTNNISVGGVGFFSDKYIAPNTNLMLEINILSQVVLTVGRVAWMSPIAHSNRYVLGAEFLELDTTGKNYLREFIDMHLSNF